MRGKKRKISIKWKVPAKWTFFGLAMGVVIATVGSVAALNGWFGGGGSIPSDTMTRGLVGYWGFEEGSGQVVYDAGDYSNNGTFGANVAASTDDPSWDKGKVGGALSFDGVDDYVDAGNGASLNITDAITIEAWVENNNLTTSKTILSKGTGGTKKGYILQENSTEKLLLILGNTTDSTTYTSVGSIPINAWTHIAVTYDNSTGQIIFYINGVGESSQTGITGITADSKVLEIGAHYAAGYFPGLIDEVRIYNRALSSAEVRYHYNRGGPAAHWKFDEGEGRTVYDSTDTNNDGTLILAGSATSSAWVAGKYGSALNLDGTNDYVKSGSNLTAVSQFSHSLWFKSADGVYSADEYLLSQGTNDPSIFIESTDSKVYVMADAANILSSNTLVNDTQWHHAEVTADGAIIKLYLDGILQSQAAYTGSSAAGLLYAGSNATPASYFGGIVDDVRIYNYARTPDEIRLDYNAGFAAHFGPKTSCDDDPASCMTQGLVAYWAFEEGSGTAIARDSSDYANNCTLISSPPWTKGKVGSALSFDGSGDYLTCGTSATIRPDTFSVEAWVRDDAVTATASIIGFSPEVGGGDSIVVSYGRSVAPARISLGASNYRIWNASPVNIYDGKWHHVVFTMPGGAQTDIESSQMWADGIQQTISSTVSTAVQAAKTQVWIGNSRNYKMTGIIDELKIYNRVLSPAEVSYHYNKGAPVLQWKMDEGEGRTAYDSTDTNNDGTLVLAGSATSSAWVSGKYGSALNLDGVNDYVKSGSNLTAVSQFSYSLWFKSADGAYSADEYLLSQGTNDPSIFVESTDSKVYVMADAANILSSNILVNDTQWHHAEVTADGAIIKLYLDGIFQSQAAYTGSSAAGLLYVGSNATPASYFGGIADDVRIYNYARTPSQVQQDYNAGLSAHFGPKTDCNLDPGACMTQGLVGYWGFEEGSGTVAYDSSNYNNNASSTLASWDKGKVGGALSFDGVDDYVDTNHDFSWLKTDSFTISLWFKTSGSQKQVILGKDDWEYQLILDPSNTLRFTYWGTSGSGQDNQNIILARANLITINTWYYVVVSYDGSVTTGKLYVNGILESIDTSAEQALQNRALNTIIGRGYYASGDSPHYFNGLIDEVRIYNRALSAAEIRYHYNKGAPAVQWKMDEGEGRTAYDSTDTNNDGTLVLAGSATSSAWVSGKYGSALNLDGTNDYVKSGSNLTAVSQFSHSLWFKSADGTYSADEYLLSQGTNDPSIFVESTDNKVYVMADGANILSSNTLVNDTQWHHAEVTADGAIIKLYLDGVLQSQAAYTGSSATGLLYAGSSATPNSYFSGIIDDVRVYNYARTPEQIRLDYNQGLGAHFK